MTLKILVVDDEHQIRRQLRIGLGGYGYEVTAVGNGEEALVSAAQHPPDVVILDIALGSAPDGIEVCQRLREWTNVPVIMLSVRDDERTKVIALNAGADDYITKPFGMEELNARVHAIRRRTEDGAANAANGSSEIRSGALVIDLANRMVRVGGEEVHLTPKEYDLLRILATHPGKIMTYHALLTEVWGSEYTDMDHYVRVFMNHLRKKLGEDPAQNLRYIMNVPGVGYRFVS